MNFLPTDYRVPEGDSNYMKLEKGANKFRILSSAIIGWEYWTKENKPVRQKEPFGETPSDARLDVVEDKNGNQKKVFRPKHFWAFVVYNYDANRIQVLEITQKTVMKDIQAYVKNEDWGDPRGYDFTVTREGEKFETKYTTIASPHKSIPEDVKQQYEEMDVNLEALYDGGDPFAGSSAQADDEFNEMTSAPSQDAPDVEYPSEEEVKE